MVNSKINSVPENQVAKAIETIVQVVYMDLKDKAGLYFINEIKRNAGEKTIHRLRETGVDLELLQLQQHYLYRRRTKTKTKGKDGKDPLSNVSLLGYSWDNVSSWNFDSKKRTCVIYGKDGKELDQLDLDSIVKHYISDLTDDGNVELQSDFKDNEGKEIKLNEKEVTLLEILYERDVDMFTITSMLKTSEDDIKYMITRLLTFEMLHYVSSNEVELTEIGIAYLKKEKKGMKVEA